MGGCCKSLNPKTPPGPPPDGWSYFQGKPSQISSHCLKLSNSIDFVKGRYCSMYLSALQNLPVTMDSIQLMMEMGFACLIQSSSSHDVHALYSDDPGIFISNSVSILNDNNNNNNNNGTLLAPISVYYWMEPNYHNLEDMIAKEHRLHVSQGTGHTLRM